MPEGLSDIRHGVNMRFAKRYARNSTAISPEEVVVLTRKRVVVVGCGGLGGYCIEMLARVGVGHLIVVDPDVFDGTNLNRQILCTEDAIGRSKVEMACARVAAVNAEVQVEGVRDVLDEGNAASIIAGADCVVDALDSADARLVLAHACARVGVCMVHGAIAGWFGQVITIFPDDVAADILFSNGSKGAEGELGNPAFTPACIASFQVAETIKVLLGRSGALRGKMLSIDMLAGSMETLELRS